MPTGEGGCAAPFKTCLKARAAAALAVTIERYERWMRAAVETCGVRP